MTFKKNIASQVVALYAWTSTNDTAKTGDSANISAFVSLDGAAEAAATNSVSELDATNCPGVYLLTLTAAETNADLVIVTGTSATANIEMKPVIIYPDLWTVDTVNMDVLLESIMAALFGVSTRSTTGTVFKNRDGTTTQLTVTHDTSGNRTVSTIT